MFQITQATKKVQKLSKRIRAVQGGTSASKTISIILVLINNAQSDTKRTVTSIVSESLPHLKRGAIKDFLAIMQEHNYFKDERWNKSDFTYTFETGSKIEFFSVDQPSKVRGPRRDRLFINEANNIPLETFEQLEVRTKEFVIMDWNPTNEFWFYTEVLGKRDDVDHLILTYRDNEALAPEIVRSIETRKNRKGWWQVYGEGLLGEVEGKIYKGWQIMDDLPFGARLERRGLDFGYTNDPTAVIDVYYFNGAYILDEVLYQNGVTNKEIANVLKAQENGTMVIADSAEPKSIDEIRLYGVNIQPATKGQGSVNQGIQYVQQQTIAMTKRSVNLIKEYRNYLWITDKDGRVLNVPEGGLDHCFIGSSLITTNKGQTPIKDIQIGDLVLTSNGYKKVLLKHDNGIKEVSDYWLHTDMQSVKISCTAEHKIKTNNSWTQISQLKQGMMVSVIKPLMESVLLSTKENDTTHQGQKECTQKSGNTTMEKYLKDFTFIIKTKIHSIINSITLNLLKGINIYQNIANKEFKTIQSSLNNSNKKVLDKQCSGTQAKQDINGIKNTGKMDGKIESTKSLSASCAVNHSSQDTQESSNTVITTAKLRHFVIGESWKDEVYDLTVEGEHEYFVNGVLVHNCMDAIRYAITSIVAPNASDSILQARVLRNRQSSNTMR